MSIINANLRGSVSNVRCLRVNPDCPPEDQSLSPLDSLNIHALPEQL